MAVASDFDRIRESGACCGEFTGFVGIFSCLQDRTAAPLVTECDAPCPAVISDVEQNATMDRGYEMPKIRLSPTPG